MIIPQLELMNYLSLFKLLKLCSYSNIKLHIKDKKVKKQNMISEV